MAIVPVEKKFREVKLDPNQWERSGPDASGVRTYTAKVDGAEVTFIKEDNGDQGHTAIPTGKSFSTQGGIADLWGLH